MCCNLIEGSAACIDLQRVVRKKPLAVWLLSWGDKHSMQKDALKGISLGLPVLIGLRRQKEGLECWNMARRCT